MKSTVGESPPEVFRPGATVLNSGGKADDCYKVLFVCHDNSTCSIIAEAIMNRWGGKDFRVFSAGIRPASEVHPVTVDLLKAQRLWGQNIQTKGCNEFLKHDAQRMNFIISIGEQRPIDLPTGWPGNPSIIHWRISEPKVDTKPAKTALAFRRTFGELENRIKLFVLVYERERVKKAAA